MDREGTLIDALLANYKRPEDMIGAHGLLKAKGSFPSEAAAIKILHLGLRNVIAKWNTAQKWKAALNHFTLLWEDRTRAAQTSKG